MSRRNRPVMGLFLTLISLTGCAPRLLVHATDYHVNVQLDPAEHTIVGRATMTLQPIGAEPLPEGRVSVAFDLHKDLVVSEVRADAAKVLGVRSKRPRKQKGHDSPNYRIHIVTLDRAAADLALSVDYHGKLFQDVEAGEKRGEIHNFEMSAHIAPEGTYLAPDGYWYPSPTIENAEELDPALLMADWRVEVDPIADIGVGAAAAPYELLASARRDPSSGDRYIWTSPHPLMGMTMTGGPHDVWTRRTGKVEVRVHMKHSDDEDTRKENEQIAQRYLDHTVEYLERYQPLIGPFPYEQFTIVENFFSSGFAFPMMTLFGPTVMHMGDNSFRHGYLDHELLHSWWGCGIEVDPRDGNWCEALTSYGANYYGFILDDDPAGARKKRRNQSNFLSRIKPEKDKPLGTYGRPDGVGRGIAYSKGAAVFHMIARKIGQENFWSAMRGLTAEYVGRSANWDDLKGLFEESGGQSLDRFFEQWVRGGGAPTLTLEAAEYNRSTGALTVRIDQGDRAFDVDVPLRVHYDDRHEDVMVSIKHAKETVTVPVRRHVLVAVVSPRAVELDPDYHVFRKLKPAEIMPTTATTKSSKRLTVVVPPGDLMKPYNTVAEDFKERFEEKKRKVQTVVADEALESDTLANGGGILILGDAVRHAAVQSFLERTICPIRWDENGFVVQGRRFDGAKEAVLCTVHHPDAPEDGVTIYMGNSESALANASILGYYANSLLVFAADPKGHGTDVVLRRDFESHQRIDVTHLSAD